MPARPGRVDQQRREALHPPEQGDVIDLDAALGEELLEIAVRQPEPQVPAHRQHDHLGREPEASERTPIAQRNKAPSEYPPTPTGPEYATFRAIPRARATGDFR